MEFSLAKRARSDNSGEMPMYRARSAARRMKRYAGVKRVPRTLSARVHVFKRVGLEQIITCDGATLKVNGVANGSTINGGLAVSNGYTPAPCLQNSQSFNGAMTFSLSSLGLSPGGGAPTPAGEITNLFDNYRIKAVYLRIDYSSNTAPITAAGSNFNGLPLITYAPDFDDAVIAISGQHKQLLLQNGYVKQKRLAAGNSTVYMKLTPRTQATSVQGGVAVVAAQGQRSVWLDSSNTNIEHYGLKFCVDDIPATSEVLGRPFWAITVTPTYVIEAKSII